MTPNLRELKYPPKHTYVMLIILRMVKKLRIRSVAQGDEGMVGISATYRLRETPTDEIKMLESAVNL